MKRPVVFALEVVASLAIASAGAWVAAKWNGKYNRESTAAERIAGALERLSPAPPTLPRPSLLHRADLKPIPEPDPAPCVSADMKVMCGPSL